MLDLSAIDPAHHDQFLALYGEDAPQETADKFARAYPAEQALDVALIQRAQAVRLEAEHAYENGRAEAEARFASEVRRLRRTVEQAKAVELGAIRAAYRGGASAPELAEALGLSIARIYQLVAGARK